MKVTPLFCFNSLRNFSYLVSSGNRCVCIDPFDAELVLAELKREQLDLVGILNTHQHFDHIRGNEHLIKTTEAQIIELKDGEVYQLSETDSLKAWFSPGHTMDHYCFLGLEKEKPLFALVGDTLFNGGVGNCKNGGVQETLFETTMKIKSELSDKLIIYPGHDYLQNNLEFSKSLGPLNHEQQALLERNPKAEDNTFPFLTLGEIKKINPFMNVANKNEFLKLRSLRDQW